MSEQKPDYIAIHHVQGRMLSRTAAEVSVRDFPPIVSDERIASGGENRGPSPLEYILVALCA